MKVRTLALTGAMSVASLGLIGTGAHAVFTENTTSTQTITAGTLSVVLSANGATGNGTPNITLPSAGPVGSSFTTGDQVVTMKNNGTIPAKEISAAISSTSPGSALASQVSICEVSFGYVIYNGLLSGAPSQPFNSVLAVNDTATYTVNVYAGSEPTACGAVTAVGHNAVAGTSTAPDLTNTAMGQSIATTITVGYSG